MSIIYRKELKLQFNSMAGYISAAALLLTLGGACVIFNFISGSSSFEYSVGLSSTALIVFVPIATMRVFAEEHRQNTDKLLYSLPLNMVQVVLGKYLALISWMAMPLLIVCAYPTILSRYGDVNLLSAYCAVIGFFFLICCLCAIGMFISALFESQIVAAVVSFIIFLAIYLIPTFSAGLSTAGSASLYSFSVLLIAFALLTLFMTGNAFLAVMLFFVTEAPLLIVYRLDIRYLSGKFALVLSSVSIFQRFSIFTAGVFSVSGVIYFISLSALFIFFTVRVMEKRRWK